MHTSFLPICLLLSAAFASADTTSTACPAQPVLESCLASTEAIAEGCGSTDYACLCQKWSTVVLCFEQCPNDPRQPAALSSMTAYCSDASIYTSSTSGAAATKAGSGATTAAGAATTAGGAVATAGGTSTGTASSTASGAVSTGSSKSGAQKDIALGAGGVIMGLAGFIGAFL